MQFLENGVLSGESLGDIHRGNFNLTLKYLKSDAQIFKKTVIIREKII